MTATMRKRIEKAEAILIRHAPPFTQTVLMGRPPDDSGDQAWAEHERAMAQAQQDGCNVIVLVPLRPCHGTPSLKG